MLRRKFLFAPLPFLPVPAVFKGEKEPREARCTCPREKRKDEGGPVVNIFPQVDQLNNDDLTIVNTTAETPLFSYTIPAGHLDGNHGVRVRIDGAMLNDSGGIVDYIFRLKLGATTMYQKTMSLADTGAAPSPLVLNFEVMAKNSNAAQETFLTLIAGGFVAATAGEGDLTNGSLFGAGYGEASENGLSALALVFSVEMDTAHADAWVLHRRSIVELL